MNDVGEPCARESHARFDRGPLAKRAPGGERDEKPSGQRHSPPAHRTASGLPHRLAACWAGDNSSVVRDGRLLPDVVDVGQEPVDGEGESTEQAAGHDGGHDGSGYPVARSSETLMTVVVPGEGIHSPRRYDGFVSSGGGELRTDRNQVDGRQQRAKATEHESHGLKNDPHGLVLASCVPRPVWSTGGVDDAPITTAGSTSMNRVMMSSGAPRPPMIPPSGDGDDVSPAENQCGANG